MENRRKMKTNFRTVILQRQVHNNWYESLALSILISEIRLVDIIILESSPEAIHHYLLEEGNERYSFEIDSNKETEQVRLQ